MNGQPNTLLISPAHILIVALLEGDFITIILDIQAIVFIVLQRLIIKVLHLEPYFICRVNNIKRKYAMKNCKVSKIFILKLLKKELKDVNIYNNN